MQKIVLLLLPFLFTFCSQYEFDEPKAESLILNHIKEQQEAWNKGDLEGFMQHYWKDDSLEFIGKNGITYGWQQTLDNYKRSYPTKAHMGTLNFDIIKNKRLDFGTAQTIGKWQLIRKELSDTLSGHFTLIWQKRKTKWVIISDHSS